MRTWTGNEVLELGQPQWKKENQPVRDSLRASKAWERELKAYQINKRKCREERRGPAQMLC